TAAWKIVHKYEHPPIKGLGSHQQTTTALFNAAGTVLAVGIAHGKVFDGDGSGSIAVYDLPTGKQKLVRTPATVELLALHPKKNIAMPLSDHSKSPLSVWDLDSGKQTGTIDTHARGGISSIAFNPSGTALLTCDRDGVARFWNVETGQELGAITQKGG